jgi:hypothetical protein
MLRQILILAAVIVYSGVAVGENLNPIVVVEHGKTFARGTFPRKGAWYGLYCNESGCEIRNAPVRITSSRAENVLGEKEPIDVFSTNDQPVALFYNVPIKPGKVTTWFVATKSMYESAHYSELQKLGRWKMPWGSKPLTISRIKLPEYGGFRYHIGDGTQKQFMFRTELEGHYGGDNTPFIHWVGDLDGDGMIDLILSLPDDNCGFDERLYLSSQAGDGVLLRKAAQLSGGQAACGC